MHGRTERWALLVIGLLALPAARGQDSSPVSLGRPVILREEMPSPPRAPAAVNQPERIRQYLRPGKTYRTHVKGTLNIRAVDQELLANVVVTLNYAFEAHIDREIESNDGRTVVEVRHFRDVRAVKIGCALEGVKLDPGPVGSALLDGLSLIGPLDIAKKAFVGANLLTQFVTKLPWVKGSLQRVLANKHQIAAVALVDQLTGKSVRLVYVDGQGVTRLEAVRGMITPADRDLHMASVLVSDCLIIPDVNIPVGVRWPVEGNSFTSLFDLALRARLDGELSLERTPDYLVKVTLPDGTVQQKFCKRVRVVDGQCTLLDEANPTQKIGYIEPRGDLDYDPETQLIIQAKFEATGEIQRFSRNHLLFTAKQMRQPTLKMIYTCIPIDTPPH